MLYEYMKNVREFVFTTVRFHFCCYKLLVVVSHMKPYKVAGKNKEN